MNKISIGTGTQLGLEVLLDGGINEYYCSSTNSYGFKILLHSPNETPRVTYYGTCISIGYETRAVVSLLLSEATAAVRKMNAKIRQCLFENENNLNFYKYAFHLFSIIIELLNNYLY